MKSEFDLDAAIAWAKNNSSSSKKVALSHSTVARHDSEWSKPNVIAPNDKAGLHQALNAAKVFDAKYRFGNDLLSVRAVAKNIGQGRVNYETGLHIQNSIFELVKSSAKKVLGKTDVSKSQVKEYLDSCHMPVSEDSSLVYVFGKGVSDNKSDGLGGGYNHSINKHLATQLNQLVNFCRTFKDKEITGYEFIEHNFDLGLCEKINTLFHFCIENVEFIFDWSGKEPAEKDAPKFISIDQKANEVLSKALKTMTADATEVQEQATEYMKSPDH